jgi:hypothetical protein
MDPRASVDTLAPASRVLRENQDPKDPKESQEKDPRAGRENAVSPATTVWTVTKEKGVSIKNVTARLGPSWPSPSVLISMPLGVLSEPCL